MTALRPGMTVREVVPGVPSRVLSLADQLRSIAAGFDQGARVFTPGEGAWFGPAFEAFAAVIGAYPPLYRQVAASFGAASVACRAHALELEAAQAQARVALNRVEDAFALTARWQALPEPRPGSDPGAELLRVLTARVAGAQERVDVSARLAAARLREASKARIPEPHVAFRVISRAVEAQRQFVFGAVEATYDLGRLAATFSPAGIVTDPKGYAASVVGIGAGLKHGVNHPGEFLAAMLDLDTWRTNPARALGRLAPDAAFTVATGGTGAATRVVTATTRGFETLTKTVNPAPTRWLATRLATSDSPSARSFADLLAHPERGSIGPLQRQTSIGLESLFRDGRPTASQLAEFASAQGWTRTQTPTGPIKYTDANGVVRLTLKQGSPRAPGSAHPHVEIRNGEGVRVDPHGSPVTRKSPGNHTPIDWDW